MAGTTLVGFEVAAGKTVLDALESEGIRVAIALWAKTSDYDEPRLFIASPDFDSGSKLAAHGRISLAIEGKFTWSAPNVVILWMKDRFVVSHRSSFSRASSVEGMRLGGQLIGDRYVEDAYVYLIR